MRWIVVALVVTIGATLLAVAGNEPDDTCRPTLKAPAPRETNKILWVARRPLDAPSGLRIEAQRMEGDDQLGEAITRVVENGPGPSTVDVPEPGCWRLTLRWAGRTDSVDLRYRARSASSG